MLLPDIFMSLICFTLDHGLGMRVIGGKRGPDGGLGAYVTYVEKKGPADSYDIVEGVFEIMQKIQQYDLSCYSDIV
jgi:hypothetical protein